MDAAADDVVGSSIALTSTDDSNVFTGCSGEGCTRRKLRNGRVGTLSNVAGTFATTPTNATGALATATGARATAVAMVPRSFLISAARDSLCTCARTRFSSCFNWYTFCSVGYGRFSRLRFSRRRRSRKTPRMQIVKQSPTPSSTTTRKMARLAPMSKLVSIDAMSSRDTKLKVMEVISSSSSAALAGTAMMPKSVRCVAAQ